MDGQQRHLFDPEGPAWTPSAPTDTSVEAAQAIVPSAKNLRAQVLEAIRRSPSTDEELGRRLGLAGNTIRPRRRELVIDGYVRDSQRRRKTKSGRSSIVWEAV